MLRYAPSEFSSVVFAGSVVNRSFGWDRLVQRGRVEQVRNYVATRDWVVAIFPGMFEQVSPLNGDLGTAGHNGFTETEGQRYQVCFIKGSHSAAIVENNFLP